MNPTQFFNHVLILKLYYIAFTGPGKPGDPGKNGRPVRVLINQF